MVSDKPVWQMGPQTRLAKDRQSEPGREPRSSVQPSLSQLAFLSTLHCLKSRTSSSAYQTSLQISTALSSLTLAQKKSFFPPGSHKYNATIGGSQAWSDSLVLVVYSHTEHCRVANTGAKPSPCASVVQPQVFGALIPSVLRQSFPC